MALDRDSINKDTGNCKTILDEFEVSFGDEDISIVKNVCYLVSERGAKLVSISKIKYLIAK
jgi:hypothetical protein